MKKNFYAVKQGRVPGIYTTWAECKEQIDGYSGAEFKGFGEKSEALMYLGIGAGEEKPDCGAVAYTDGSFSVSDGRYAFGVVLFTGGEKLTFSQAFENPEMAQMRNVAGEIAGAEFVMDYCLKNNIPSVEIRYDYEGVEKWCTGVWKTNKEGTIAYSAFYNSIKDRLKVVFTKVKGHSGDKYNDEADRLAKDALGIE